MSKKMMDKKAQRSDDKMDTKKQMMGEMKGKMDNKDASMKEHQAMMKKCKQC